MSAVYNFLLYLTGWPLALVLFVGGIYFTIRTKFPQFRMFKESIRVISEKPEKEGSISSFGAVFWMWVTALLGGASALVESTLAQIYKKKDAEGGSYGGPAYYIEAALHSRALAIVFSIALIFTYGVGYNMLASYNLQSSFAGFASLTVRGAFLLI